MKLPNYKRISNRTEPILIESIRSCHGEPHRTSNLIIFVFFCKKFTLTRLKLNWIIYLYFQRFYCLYILKHRNGHLGGLTKYNLIILGNSNKMSLVTRFDEFWIETQYPNSFFCWVPKYESNVKRKPSLNFSLNFFKIDWFLWN